MSFTELSIFKLATATVSPELQAVLEEAHSARVALCSDSWTFQQVEDPSTILIATNWPSHEAQRSWLQSETYASIGKRLAEFMSKGDAASQTVSLSTKVLSGAPVDAALTALVSSPVISVGRIFVTADNRAAFTEKFNHVKGIAEDYARPFEVRCGWRTNKEADSKEEFVMIAGWPAVEKHKEFVTTPGFIKYSEIRGFSEGADIQHYERILRSQE